MSFLGWCESRYKSFNPVPYVMSIISIFMSDAISDTSNIIMAQMERWKECKYTVTGGTTASQETGQGLGESGMILSVENDSSMVEF